MSEDRLPTQVFDCIHVEYDDNGDIIHPNKMISEIYHSDTITLINAHDRVLALLDKKEGQLEIINMSENDYDYYWKLLNDVLHKINSIKN
jgi:hypothetical protein